MALSRMSVRIGLDVAGYGMGVAIGDMNNTVDGSASMRVFGCFGIWGRALCRITREAGLDDIHWATSAAIDFNRDGWLDRRRSLRGL